MRISVVGKRGTVDTLVLGQLEPDFWPLSPSPSLYFLLGSFPPHLFYGIWVLDATALEHSSRSISFMSQNPLNAPLAFLKNHNANASASSFDQPSQSPSSPNSRSRSSSFMRVVYPNHSPRPALSLARRSLSVSESRRPSSVAFAEDFQPLHANFSATSLSQPSETNWAGRIDDFDVKNPIGTSWTHSISVCLYVCLSVSRPPPISLVILTLILTCARYNQAMGPRLLCFVPFISRPASALPSNKSIWTCLSVTKLMSSGYVLR